MRVNGGLGSRRRRQYRITCPHAPSFPSTTMGRTTAMTIVRKISDKCMLFCRIERHTASVHTPGMHYAHGPCRGYRRLYDACFARAFSHVLVSHVVRSRTMALPRGRISMYLRMRVSIHVRLSPFRLT